jgi:uncharacterized protein YdhG (YjbR/CyaY superfamily)
MAKPSSHFVHRRPIARCTRLAERSFWKSKLGAFAASKGTIRFTPEKPIPAALIKAVLRVRAQELRVS